MHYDCPSRVQAQARELDVAKGTQPVIEPRLVADPPARDTPPLIPESVSGPWMKLPGAQKLNSTGSMQGALGSADSGSNPDTACH